MFASGNGSNFEAIVEACQSGTIPAKVKLLVCDKPSAFVLQRAERLGVPYITVIKEHFDSKPEYEQAIVEALRRANIYLICLAGYMKIVGATLLQAYNNRILNIHPALLPSFKGANAIRDAFDFGVKVFGVTVHLIDNTIDGGTIISQRAFEYNGNSIVEVEDKIHTIEHQLFPEAINIILQKS